MDDEQEREFPEEEIEQFMEDFKRLNARPASILEVGGFRPTGHPLTSHIGLSPVMRPGEQWPFDSEGRPMQFIAQLNLSKPLFVPEVLHGDALVTVFIAEDCIQRRFAPRSWELRAYQSLDDLAPMTAPSQPWDWMRGFECRWQGVTDYPCYDDAQIQLPQGYSLEDDLPEEMHSLNVRRSKIGGFASTIQHEVEFWSPSGWQRGGKLPFAFQIGSEDKTRLMWADNGRLYVGRIPGTEEWFASCQFY